MEAKMFTSILNTSTETLSVLNALLCIGTALVLGLMISFTYMAGKSYTKNFAVTLVTLPILVQIVIMMVNGNLGTGIAIVGAFSLVRFRSVPGSSKEISFVFFAMAAGLATGMGYLTYSAAMAAVICGIYILLFRFKFGETSGTERKLKITIPENLDYSSVFDDLFDKYTAFCELEKIKTTNLGSMFELHYKVALKDLSLERNFIDDLRCRNGNLTIVLSRKQSQQDEL
jgi:hypothetical protein